MARAKRKIVLVTGATGFVGRYTVQRLLQEPNLYVRCLVRENSDRSGLTELGRRVSFVTGDITDTKHLTLWAGVNLPLYLSGATFVLGFLLYAFHIPLRAFLE